MRGSFGQEEVALKLHYLLLTQVFCSSLVAWDGAREEVGLFLIGDVRMFT